VPVRLPLDPLTRRHQTPTNRSCFVPSLLPQRVRTVNGRLYACASKSGKSVTAVSLRQGRAAALNTIVCRPAVFSSSKFPLQAGARSDWLKVTTVAKPSHISSAIDSQVLTDVTRALGDVRTSGQDFIVNDSHWYAVNDRGKITPCVMNSAHFLSKRFLGALGAIGWTTEESILEQTIDAYIEIRDSNQAYRVKADSLITLRSTRARPKASRPFPTRVL